jgi:hypothetical protein
MTKALVFFVFGLLRVAGTVPGPSGAIRGVKVVDRRIKDFMRVERERGITYAELFCENIRSLLVPLLKEG